jgi:arylsulfatase A-like enzyme
MRPNILFYFTDQQRWDTLGCMGQPLPVTPCLDALAEDGVCFEQAYSPQPVCGPCRAMFQTGQWAAQLGCFRNNLALPEGVKTLADYFEESGYETAYVGKWHLASSGALDQKPDVDYTVTAIPPERRGGYRGFWRAADVLEFTSHGYDGYVFDEHMNKRAFTGYRADCITDFALEFLDAYDGKRPFFLTVSHIEPHHQNDAGHYQGPIGSKERFANFTLPPDLAALGGNAAEEYPDYLGCCRQLDDNLARLVGKLKGMGIFDNTVIVFASDHGSHFKTRNRDAHLCGGDDYKRSCHDACLHVPLVLRGPGFRGGRRIKELVSTASLPKTFLAMAGVSADMIGEDLRQVADHALPNRENVIFAQISESRVGRCIRTPRYLYSVYAPGKNGGECADADLYADDFLYDMANDPFQLHNLVGDPAYASIREELAALLLRKMHEAGERPAKIVKSV